jgi:SpoVK/Ycf46/Vps4 family AAA+-type ATPase
MDGLDKNSIMKNNRQPRVVIIGATNRPNSIDSALRRPGRFDREFEIGIPSPDSRFDILSILLESINHSLIPKEIRDISDKAHGYVGADLAAICREAGLNAIKRFKRQTDNIDKQSGKSLLPADDVVIGLQDMLSGMTLVKPSVIREISLQVPKVYWHQIGGQNEIKQKLKEAVEWPLKNPQVFIRFNIKPPKGLLLYGPPGCSKTLMAKALATEAGLNFLAVKGPELFSKWVGDSEKAVQQIFKKARAAAPSVIFFDEIDALAVKRSGDSAVADRVLSQLLMEMDGMEPLVNVTVIAATNRPDILDSALLRPGRIDSILYVSPPDLPSRQAIFTIQLKRIPTNGVDPLVLAELTEGFSGAEVVAVCQNAASAAMMESLDATTVDMKHFLDSISKTVPRITPEMIEFYQRFRDRSGLASV